MQRTYIFLAEITSGLTLLKLTPETKNELFNIGLIIAVRIGFYLFEKKFPKIKQIFAKKEAK